MRNTFVVALWLGVTSAIDLDISDPASIRKAASTIAHGTIKYYTGNVTNTPSTVGVLPAPYYWWEAGALWGAMLDYYHYTGDSTYNTVTTQAILSQVGPSFDYMVPAHVKDEGNDDQAFWGFATMSAAEKDYPQPIIGNYSWLELTENLWNTQVRRWDTSTCGGGLRWQIFTFNNGYDYKNTVSNGAFFQLSARLARFTGNQTYVDWAEKVYDWTRSIGLLDEGYNAFDGTNNLQNCSEINRMQWTYNLAILTYGSAVMYNYTNGSSLWAERTQGFLRASAVFFSPFNNSTNIMFEPACETIETCNNDQFSFKGYLSRFLWASTLMAPFTTSAVSTLLTTSAQAASRSCSGGTDGVTCGTKWYTGSWDGTFGVGQQISALETVQGLLVGKSVPPMHSNMVHLKAEASPGQAPVPTATTSAPKKTNAAAQKTGEMGVVVGAVLGAGWAML